MRLGRIQNNYTQEGFDIVKESGLQFVEVCCNNAGESEAFVAAKDQIKELVRNTGIDVSCVGRWNHDVNENGKINNDKVKGYFDLIDAAIDVGAKTFVCGCNYDHNISLYRNYINAVEFFGSLIERADDKIKIAIQNCDWNNFVVSTKHWEVILGELPKLCIKFDPSHAYNRREDYMAQLNEWGNRVAHIHIKGTTHAGNRGVADPPAGMDDIRWPAIMSVLYSNRYEGDLSIEPHSGVWNGELGKAGVEFTRNYINQFLLG